MARSEMGVMLLKNVILTAKNECFGLLFFVCLFVCLLDVVNLGLCVVSLRHRGVDCMVRANYAMGGGEKGWADVREKENVVS